MCAAAAVEPRRHFEHHELEVVQLALQCDDRGVESGCVGGDLNARDGSKHHTHTQAEFQWSYSKGKEEPSALTHLRTLLVMRLAPFDDL